MMAGVFYYIENFPNHLAVIFNHRNTHMNEDKYKN